MKHIWQILCAIEAKWPLAYWIFLLVQLVTLGSVWLIYLCSK